MVSCSNDYLGLRWVVSRYIGQVKSISCIALSITAVSSLAARWHRCVLSTVTGAVSSFVSNFT